MQRGEIVKVPKECGRERQVGNLKYEPSYEIII